MHIIGSYALIFCIHGSALDQIRQSVEQVSQYRRFDCLLKRQEISGSIEESHASLDRCMELFNVRCCEDLSHCLLIHDI